MEENIASGKSLLDLPNELLEHIMSSVSIYRDLPNLRLVCARLRDVATTVLAMNRLKFESAIDNGDLVWSYLKIQKGPSIAARYLHSACYYNKAVYVFGGCSSSTTCFNDTWKLDLVNGRWQRLMLRGTYPPPKSWATMVLYKDKLLLYGGCSYSLRNILHQQSLFFDHVHSLDPRTLNWQLATTKNNPEGRGGHQSTVVNDKMLVIGGSCSYRRRSNEVWLLDLKSMIWLKKSIHGPKPTSRTAHSQILLDESHILIMGGYGGNKMHFCDVWLLTMLKDDDYDEYYLKDDNSPTKYSTWFWSELKVGFQHLAPQKMWGQTSCKVNNRLIILGKWCESTSDKELKVKLKQERLKQKRCACNCHWPSRSEDLRVLQQTRQQQQHHSNLQQQQQHLNQQLQQQQQQHHHPDANLNNTANGASNDSINVSLHASTNSALLNNHTPSSSSLPLLPISNISQPPSSLQQSSSSAPEHLSSPPQKKQSFALFPPPPPSSPLLSLFNRSPNHHRITMNDDDDEEEDETPVNSVRLNSSEVDKTISTTPNKRPCVRPNSMNDRRRQLEILRSYEEKFKNRFLNPTRTSTATDNRPSSNIRNECSSASSNSSGSSSSSITGDGSSCSNSSSFSNDTFGGCSSSANSDNSDCGDLNSGINGGSNNGGGANEQAGQNVVAIGADNAIASRRNEDAPNDVGRFRAHPRRHVGCAFNENDSFRNRERSAASYGGVNRYHECCVCCPLSDQFESTFNKICNVHVLNFDDALQGSSVHWQSVVKGRNFNGTEPVFYSLIECESEIFMFGGLDGLELCISEAEKPTVNNTSAFLSFKEHVF